VRGPVAGQFVSDQHPGHVAQAREQAAEELPGRVRVATRLDEDVQHVTVLVDIHTPTVIHLKLTPAHSDQLDNAVDSGFPSAVRVLGWLTHQRVRRLHSIPASLGVIDQSEHRRDSVERGGIFDGWR
jgi:hypothetical protein